MANQEHGACPGQHNQVTGAAAVLLTETLQFACKRASKVIGDSLRCCLACAVAMLCAVLCRALRGAPAGEAHG